MSSGGWALTGFLAAFLFIRASTRLMRSPRVPWWPGSIKTRGVHVHHLVIGIALMIGAGFATFALEADGSLMAVLAIVFGVGVGLTIDEFALWLYLEDVYWAREGRSSVDVAIVVAVLGLLVLNTSGPFDTEDGSDWALLASVVAHLAWAALVIAKGKIRLAAIGFFLPPIYLVAGIRLARPNSIWARRFYRPGTPKLAKATARATAWDARRERWLDRIGGAPSIERPRD